MSKIGINVEANTSKARKDLQSLNKEVKELQKTAAKGAKINLQATAPKGGMTFGGMKLDKIGDLGKLTDLKGILSDKIGGMSLKGLTGLGTGIAGGVSMAAAAAGAWYSEIKGIVDSGKEAQATYERLNATLGQIGRNVAGISDVSTTVKFLQEMAAKGKTPLDALEQTANRLMVAFKGNQSEVKKWTEIIADMSAGSGEGVTMLTEVITKAKQFNTVEFSVFTTLNEKGIPIIEKLAEHLGTTTDKAKELAQAGKVTGDNFMKAYEMAHAMTYAGANAQGGISTVSGAQNAIDKYKELQAAAATEGYNSQMLTYLQQRAAYEENKYKSPYERLNSKSSGMLVGSIDATWQKFTDGVTDLAEWAAKLVGSGSVDALSSAESLGASLSTAGFRALGADGVIYNSNGEYEKSAVIDGYLQEMRAQLEQERAKIGDDNFSDEARAHARQAAQDLTQAISICEDALRAVKAHEAELAEIERKQQAEAEGKRVRDAYNLSRADTANAYATAMGYDSLDALRGDYNSIRGRVADGKGNQADLDRLNELQRVIDLATKEADTAAKMAQGRREYDLSADSTGKVQLQVEQEAAKLKALGFTSDEVETRLNTFKDRLLADTRDRQQITSDNLQKTHDSISYACGGGAMDYHKWERNAWGAAGATYTTFQNPIDQQQLRQLQKANDNLKALITATEKIDTKALAQ